MADEKVIRAAKIAKEVPLVTCGNEIFRDKTKEYPETLWREEGKFDELIKLGYLTEVKKPAVAAKKTEPVKT